MEVIGNAGDPRQFTCSRGMYVCIFCKHRNAWTRSHVQQRKCPVMKERLPLGETMTVSRITAARCPSPLRFLRRSLDASFPPSASSLHVAYHACRQRFEPAHTQARSAFIRSVRLICVRNNLTPELVRVPAARVATSPLAIPTGAHQINRHDDRYRDDSRVCYG